MIDPVEPIQFKADKGQETKKKKQVKGDRLKEKKNKIDIAQGTWEAGSENAMSEVM